MSFDMFVQSFVNGDARVMPVSAFDVFRPHIDQHEPELRFWHVRTPDSGQADIYADPAPGTFDSLMISRFSDGGPLALLAQFISRANAVILAPGLPTMLAAEAQRHHLPEPLQPDAVIVRSGSDIQQIIRSAQPVDALHSKPGRCVTHQEHQSQIRTRCPHRVMRDTCPPADVRRI